MHSVNPLIDNFTKNLSPCNGCGQLPQSVLEAINKGKNVIFILQVQVEAENAAEAIQKVGTGAVLAVNPRPQQVQPVQTTTFGSRGQGSQLPSHMQVSPTPTTTVTQPTNG